MEALAAKSLAEAVGERIMRAIAVGDLKPGARLNEAQMAAQLGVSRGPIREAARELEGQGFLISRTNQGFYVAAFAPEDIRDVYEAKDWLETAFIADLAENMSTADRRAILSDLETLDIGDRVAFTEALFRFRARVTARLRNRFLADLMTVMHRKFYIISVIVDVVDERARFEHILNVQRRFWRRMAEGDVDGARVEMREDTAYWLKDLPPRFPAPQRRARRMA